MSRRSLFPLMLMAAADASPGGAVVELPTRDELRASLLANVEVPVDVGELRERKSALQRPTAGQRGDIYQRATSFKENGEVSMDMAKLQLSAIVATAHTLRPDGKPGQPIFEATDAAAILAQAAGTGVLDILGPQAIKALGSPDVAAAKKD